MDNMLARIRESIACIKRENYKPTVIKVGYEEVAKLFELVDGTGRAVKMNTGNVSPLTLYGIPLEPVPQSTYLSVLSSSGHEVLT